MLINYKRVLRKYGHNIIKKWRNRNSNRKYVC